MADEDHRAEVAILEFTRRLQARFEPHAATNARLRQAVKRFEAATDAFEAPSVGAQFLHRRVK